MIVVGIGENLTNTIYMHIFSTIYIFTDHRNTVAYVFNDENNN